MGARKEVYSPGMLTPSSAEQQGQISFQMEGNSMFALTEGSNNKTSQVKAAIGMAEDRLMCHRDSTLRLI